MIYDRINAVVFPNRPLLTTLFFTLLDGFVVVRATPRERDRPRTTTNRRTAESAISHEIGPDPTPFYEN